MLRSALAAGFAAAFLALTAAAAQAEPPPDANSTCAQAPCRPGRVHFSLLEGDGQHGLEGDFDAAPYIHGDVITIFPGETLIFRFTPTDDGPGIPAFVGVGTSVVPHHLATDDPNRTEQHDPATGETYFTVPAGSPLVENGTAEDHLKGQPPGTLILALHQVYGRPDMVLSIEHNLPKALKLDAAIGRARPDISKKMDPTSTCAAKPLFSASETWPYPIAAINLTNFRYIDISNGLHCE